MSGSNLYVFEIQDLQIFVILNVVYIEQKKIWEVRIPPKADMKTQYAGADLGIITNYNELTNYKNISFLEPENNLREYTCSL